MIHSALQPTSPTPDTDHMRNRIASGLDRFDRAGGKLVSRLLGFLVLVAVIGVGVPLLVGALRSRDWVAALIVLVAVAGGLALIRYLFSNDRRLSDME